MNRPLRVLALSRYAQLGASSRQRMLQYVPLLRQFDIEVTVRPLSSDAYLGGLYRTGRRSWPRVARDYLVRLLSRAAYCGYDVWWIEKELFPFIPHILERFWSLGSPPRVVEYDDASFHVYDQHPRALVRRLFANKIDRVMRASALTIAGSDYIAARARCAQSAAVITIPTTVLLQRYPLLPTPPARPFTIGWIGTPRTARYLEPLRPVLSALRERQGAQGVRLLVIGADQLAWGDNISVRSWSYENEVRDLHECDVGIMPLPDEPFERGKCAYKLIQYMACCLPVVASPIGSNCRLVLDAKCGMLCTTAQEWLEALDSLRLDASLRQRLGAQGRRHVENHASAEVVAPQLADILRRAARRA